MDGQRQRSDGGRRRRRKARPAARANPELVLIAARRPSAALSARSPEREAGVTASSVEELTTTEGDTTPVEQAEEPSPEPRPQRRSARIVALPTDPDSRQVKERQRLLDRLMTSDGRGAISRAATELRAAGFDFPEEQVVQLQLLEHFDEDVARGAVDVLTRLLGEAPPLKRPVLEQRLRRLEEYAEDSSTREAAAALRRSLRS